MATLSLTAVGGDAYAIGASPPPPALAAAACRADRPGLSVGAGVTDAGCGRCSEHFKHVSLKAQFSLKPQGHSQKGLRALAETCEAF